ncbi:hypothetical protein CYMTET_45622, partial [Cymbomonas tetramitiformis]
LLRGITGAGLGACRAVVQVIGGGWEFESEATLATHGKLHPLCFVAPSAAARGRGGDTRVPGSGMTPARLHVCLTAGNVWGEGGVNQLWSAAQLGATWQSLFSRASASTIPQLVAGEGVVGGLDNTVLLQALLRQALSDHPLLATHALRLLDLHFCQQPIVLRHLVATSIGQDGVSHWPASSRDAASEAWTGVCDSADQEDGAGVLRELAVLLRAAASNEAASANTTTGHTGSSGTIWVKLMEVASRVLAAEGVSSPQFSDHGRGQGRSGRHMARWHKALGELREPLEALQGVLGEAHAAAAPEDPQREEEMRQAGWLCRQLLRRLREEQAGGPRLPREGASQAGGEYTACAVALLREDAWHACLQTLGVERLEVQMANGRRRVALAMSQAQAAAEQQLRPRGTAAASSPASGASAAAGSDVSARLADVGASVRRRLLRRGGAAQAPVTGTSGKRVGRNGGVATQRVRLSLGWVRRVVQTLGLMRETADGDTAWGALETIREGLQEGLRGGWGGEEHRDAAARVRRDGALDVALVYLSHGCPQTCESSLRLAVALLEGCCAPELDALHATLCFPGGPAPRHVERLCGRLHGEVAQAAAVAAALRQVGHARWWSWDERGVRQAGAECAVREEDTEGLGWRPDGVGQGGSSSGEGGAGSGRSEGVAGGSGRGDWSEERGRSGRLPAGPWRSVRGCSRLARVHEVREALSRLRLVLRLLRLLVRGNHRGMQALLQAQPQSRCSQDLVSDVLRAIHAVQPAVAENLLMGGAAELPALKLELWRTLTALLPDTEGGAGCRLAAAELPQLASLLLASVRTGMLPLGDSLAAPPYLLVADVLAPVLAMPAPRGLCGASNAAVCCTIKVAMLELLAGLLEGREGAHAAALVAPRLSLSSMQVEMRAVYSLLSRLRECTSEDEQRHLLGALLLPAGCTPSPPPGAAHTPLDEHKLARDADPVSTPQAVCALLLREAAGYRRVLALLEMHGEGRHVGRTEGGGAAELLQQMEHKAPEMFRFYTSLTAFVELCAPDGTLHRVVFPVPMCCTAMLQDPRQRAAAERRARELGGGGVVAGAGWGAASHAAMARDCSELEDPRKRAAAFMRLARLISFDLRRHVAGRGSCCGQPLLRRAMRAGAAGALTLPVLICCLLVASRGLEGKEAEHVGAAQFEWAIPVMSVGHLACAVMAMLRHWIEDGPMIARARSLALQATRPRHVATAHEVQDGAPSSMAVARALLQCPRAQVLTAAAVLSLLGMLLSPLWYALHLVLLWVEVALAHASSQLLCQAFCRGLPLLLAALGLALALVIAAAFGAYAWFPVQLAEAWRGASCTFPSEEAGGCSAADGGAVTLFQAVAALAPSLFLGRDLLQMMDPGLGEGAPSQWRLTPPTPLEDATRQASMVYAAGVSLILQLIFVGGVTAIMVEALAAERAFREAVDALAHRQCAVCGLARAEVQAGGGGHTLEDHMRSVHNPWHYVSYLVYLEKKKCEEYTWLEAQVVDQLNRGSYDFLPTLHYWHLKS